MRQKKPKVLLFDIGGVCVRLHYLIYKDMLTKCQVVSPFQAILDYEKQYGVPVGYINYSIRELTPDGSWHKIERGELKLNDQFFQQFKADIQRLDLWRKFHADKLGLKDSSKVPPVPNVDAEKLYWTMMSTARENDPYMYPALKKLKQRGWKLAAMSNTTIFPEGHAFNERSPEDVRDLFDVFVSSAHVGMRKPNRDIYDYTLGKLRERWPQADIKPEDILFLDDIGENLKMGKQLGMKTIRVYLGKTENAVKELGTATGEDLSEDSRRAKL